MALGKRGSVTLILVAASLVAGLWWATRETAAPEGVASEDTVSRESESDVIPASEVAPARTVEGPESARPDNEAEPSEVMPSEIEAFDELLSARLEELQAELAIAEGMGATDRAEELRARIEHLGDEAQDVRNALDGTD